MTLLTHVGSYCANGAVLFIDNQLYILSPCKVGIKIIIHITFYFPNYIRYKIKQLTKKPLQN